MTKHKSEDYKLSAVKYFLKIKIHKRILVKYFSVL